MKKFTRFMFISAILLVAGSNAAWGNSSAKVTVISEPSNGGQVTVNSSNSAGSYGTQISSQQTTGSKWTFETKKKFTFYRFQNTNNNYVFKGWATSNTANSGETQSSVTVTGSSLSSDYPETKYYAIFARMTANESSVSFGQVNVGASSTAQTITIIHAHAGKITASVSGDNAGEYTISTATPVANSVSEGTQDITVTFAPTCNGTRTATLTLHSDNGLSDVVISLTGEGVLNEQSLTWDNEPIDQNMILGSTLNISATATSGLAVTYTSSNPAVVSISGNTLTAIAVGTAEITASQAGDCTYSPANNITKEFTVNDKATPTFWLNNDPSQTEADLKVGESVTIYIENTTEALQSTYDSNNLSIAQGEGTITVTALGAIDNTTLTFVQPETATIYGMAFTFTFHITKNTATLTNDLAAEYKVDDEITITDIYTATNDEIAVTVVSSDESVVKVEGEKLVAVGAGTADVTISQAEDYKWNALSETKTVTVSKHANAIVWSFAGEEAISKTLSYNEQVEIACTSSNADVENSPITIVQTEGEDIATYDNEQRTITASYHNGTAIWTVSQPEDRKYLAAEVTISVTVAAMQANCYAVEDAASHSIGWYSNSNGIEYTLNGVGETLSIDVWKENAATDAITLYGYDSNGNETKIAEYSASSLSTSATTKTVDIAETVTKVKVKAGGTLNKHFGNLYITRRQVLTPFETAIALPTSEIGGQTTATFTLTWSSCADLIYIASDNPKFTFTPSVVPTNGGAGTADITVTYSSDEIETATATATIYTPYQQATVAFSTTTGKKAQTITWEDDIATMPADTGAVMLNATAESTVTYTSSDANVAYIEGNILHIVTYGTVTITAIAAETEQYLSDTLRRDITILPLTPYISENPTISPIMTGQSLSYATIFDGEADTEGTFVWADDEDIETVFTEAGEYIVHVQFVPTNINWYAVVDDIELTVTVIANTATGVEATSVQGGVQKVLYHGQVYILRDGKIYDVMGRMR